MYSEGISTLEALRVSRYPPDQLRTEYDEVRTSPSLVEVGIKRVQVIIIAVENKVHLWGTVGVAAI